MDTALIKTCSLDLLFCFCSDYFTKTHEEECVGNIESHTIRTLKKSQLYKYNFRTETDRNQAALLKNSIQSFL